MQIDWFTFIAQAVNFLILIALLHHFLYKPVIKAMDERDKRIADELEEARRKTVEAEQKEKMHQQQLETFEAQKEQRMTELREEVSQRKAEMMEEVRGEVEDVRERWIEAIETEKESFTEKLGKETAQQVLGLLNTILQDLSERSLQLQTVQVFLQKISGISDSDLEQFRQNISSSKENKVRVISSFELAAEQQNQIMEGIRERIAESIECEFLVDEELGFGIELRASGWRIGWNLKGYLEQLSLQMDEYFRKQRPVQSTSNIS